MELIMMVIDWLIVTILVAIAMVIALMLHHIFRSTTMKQTMLVEAPVAMVLMIMEDNKLRLTY